MSPMEYRCISADSHIEVVPSRYTNRVPERYRERAPKAITLEDGTLAVAQEGKPLGPLMANLSAGKPYEERHPYDPLPGPTYESSPGAGTPEQRLSEQDLDGVDAEVLFAGIVGPSFWRGIPNDDVYKAVVRAYNDWLAEEYCAVNPERLLGVGVIPETNLEDALAEMEHCAKTGLKAVELNAFPTGSLQPAPEDDRFYHRAIDLGMPLTIHAQFGFPPGGTPPPRPSYNYAKDSPIPEIHAPDMLTTRYNVNGFRGAVQAVQMVCSGLFDRLPDLRLYIADVQVGWIPNWPEQVDNNYVRSYAWVERTLGLPQLPRWPSEYAREHFWWGFGRNPVGVDIAKQGDGSGPGDVGEQFPIGRHGLAEVTASDRRVRCGAFH